MIIPNYSAYDVDTHGVVTEIATGRKVRQHHDRYAYVNIMHDSGKRHRESIHVLMAMTYLSKPKYPCVVAFKDNNPDNLELSNLEYISRSELSMRRYNSAQPRRSSMCDTPEARQMLLDTMKAFDYPLRMTELADILVVPYSVVRYSMYHLINDGLARKVEGGGYTAT